MRYSPSSEFDSTRVWRRVIVYFLIGGLLVLGGFGYWAWRQTEQQIHDKLHIEARLAANSARSVFQGLTDDLPYLALQLVDRGGESLTAEYGLLKMYQDHHPYVASFVLFAPDGRMLLNTARPCCSAGLPDPRQHEAFLKSLLNTFKVPGVWIGQTQRGLVLHEWRIPVRYVVRDAHGNARAILQASVLLSYLVKQWVRDPLLSDTALGLLRMDGLHIAREPAPDPQRIYSTRMAGPLARVMSGVSYSVSGGGPGGPGSLGMSIGSSQFIAKENYKIAAFGIGAIFLAGIGILFWKRSRKASDELGDAS